MRRDINAIVFDLGGVLIDWNPRYLYGPLLGHDPERMELFLRDVCNQHWNEKQDAGRSFVEAIEELGARYPNWRSMIDIYFSRWHEMIRGPIQGTVDILGELRTRQWPLYALTNWSAETFPIAIERFEFLRWFQGIVVSGVEKMVKPEPRFFELLLSRYELAAASTLFIDDVVANCSGAAAVGLQVIHFQSPEQLRGELQRLEIL